MTKRFLDSGPRDCKRPVGDTVGMFMEICGAPTMLGKSYCRACRARLYYKPTKQELKAMDAIVAAPLRATGARAG